MEAAKGAEVAMAIVKQAEETAVAARADFDAEASSVDVALDVLGRRNGDTMNPSFQILDLENYDNVMVRIFDRWGNLVYTNDDYKNTNAWYGDDSADGTYWYTILLPNGLTHQGTVSIFR